MDSAILSRFAFPMEMTRMSDREEGLELEGGGGIVERGSGRSGILWEIPLQTKNQSATF